MQKVAPAELAEGLLNEFVSSAGSRVSENLNLDGPVLAGFTEKARRYGIASVLMAISREEQKHSRFTAVRAEFEKLIFPPTPTAAGMATLDGIKSAMQDLSGLLFPEGRPKEMSWARNWLSDIGANESNPATLALFSIYWLDYHIMASKALQSFEVV